MVRNGESRTLVGGNVLGLERIEDVTVGALGAVEVVTPQLAVCLRADQEQPQSARSAIDTGRRAVWTFESDARPFHPRPRLLVEAATVEVVVERLGNRVRL